MEILTIVWLFLAGLGAGFINTVGGGGSILTLPALILLGEVPAMAANATNRMGLIVQNMMAIWRFRKGGVREDKLALILTAVMLPGVVIGAWMAASISDEVFRPLLGWLMLVLLVLVLLKPQPKLLEAGEISDAWRDASPSKRVFLSITMFLVALYMGFLQAGAGILILVVLGWFLRLDLVRGNYVKLVMILLANVLAFGIFYFQGIAIYWIAGTVVFLGQIAGAYVGSWFALKKGEGWIKVILTVAILASSAKLLGVFEWFK